MNRNRQFKGPKWGWEGSIFMWTGGLIVFLKLLKITEIMAVKRFQFFLGKAQKRGVIRKSIFVTYISYFGGGWLEYLAFHSVMGFRYLFFFCGGCFIKPSA